MKRLFTILAALALLLALAACKKDPAKTDPSTDPSTEASKDPSSDASEDPSVDATIALTAISLDKQEITLWPGESEVLTVTFTPADATDKTIVWSSSDDAVATVEDGTVTAVAEGTATITAKSEDGGFTATCQVTITPEGTVSGVFSVSPDTRVYFSKGNLQAVFDEANATTCTWKFAENQYTYIGNAAANTKVGYGTVTDVTEGGTVDLFGWVGASSIWTGLDMYGITCSTNQGKADGYGDRGNEELKIEWGTTMGPDWRTLSKDEWVYLIDTRSASTIDGTENARYALARLFGRTFGLILFPDNYAHPSGVDTPTCINGDNFLWPANEYSTDDWSKMEAAGCVFLPAAGTRRGIFVYYVNNWGVYWSSTSCASIDAYYLRFIAGEVIPAERSLERSDCNSVRLVRNQNSKLFQKSSI